jgi:hypothetical protein
VQPDNSILKSGEKFAKEAGTTIAVEAVKPQGQTGELTASITHAGETEKASWDLTAWFKRKFQKDGNSAGVKGEVRF